MDNLELYYRHHRIKHDIPTNYGKYLNCEIGVKRAVGRYYDFKNPYDLQSMVRSGEAGKILKIRDQLSFKKDGVDVVFDVIGIDHDTPTDPRFTHSLTLQMHDCIAELQFDAAEAMYSQAEILSAGTYNFTVTSHPWYAADVGKTFQFTLLNDVPANGQIVLSATYNATMDGKSVKVYAAGTSTTVLETATLSEGDSGTSLGSFGNAVNENLNSLHRAFLGSNNYKNSALRQWLKSDKTAGQVWTPQTKWDRPPSWAANTAGMLNGFDPDFLAVVGSTHIIAPRAVNYEGNPAYDEMDDKFFLISRTEAYGGKEVSTVNDGTPYPYYSDYSDLTAPGIGVDSNRIKYRNGAAKWWWTRTPNVDYGYNVRGLYTAGYVYSYGVNNGLGVSAACNII